MVCVGLPSYIPALYYSQMDKNRIEHMFAEVDARLENPVRLVVYGAAAFILLGEEGRTSLDVDVAGPYCQGNLLKLRQIFLDIGYPVNPPPHEMRDHIEWVGVERLSLQVPDENMMTLWAGRYLTVVTVSAPALVASKLIRYDETDQSDIRSLCSRMRVKWEHVRDAVQRLPPTFRDDPIVQDNLASLKQDMMMWGGKS